MTKTYVTGHFFSLSPLTVETRLNKLALEYVKGLLNMYGEGNRLFPYNNKYQTI
jgi:hypothetical protein